MVADLVAETVAWRHAEPDDLSGDAPTGRVGHRSPRRGGQRHGSGGGGRPWTYNLGLVVFTVFSVLLAVTWLHGTAGTLWLIVTQVLQGVGGRR